MHKCPVDNSLLEVIEKEHSPLKFEKGYFMLCHTCNRIWVERKLLLEIANNYDVEIIKLLEDYKKPENSNNPIKNCCCGPNIKLTPRVVNGITIDICHNCKGIWFDKGELLKVLEIEDKIKEIKKVSKVTLKGLKGSSIFVWELLSIITSILDIFNLSD